MTHHKKFIETLSFESGSFILKDASTPGLRKVLSQNAEWKSLGDDAFLTTSLGAARTYRRFADEKLEKIFQKRFQEFYPLPVKWPQLPGLDLHQIKGIHWILSRKRSYLAHAPGAGKTAQAIIASCLSKGPGQILFIVPPSLTKNWEREIFKFTDWVDPNSFPTIGMVGSSDQKESVAWRSDFIIVPDSMLTKGWVYEEISKRLWKFIAVDEASRFKESDSQRTLALFGGHSQDRTFRGFIGRARHAVLMDGSPMPNRPIELWAPTFSMDPESIDCMGYDAFGYRYCGARPNHLGQWEYKFSSHEDELKAKIQKSFMHVVRESELSHPERRRSIVVMNRDVRSAEHQDWQRREPRELRELSGEPDTKGELARFRKELGIAKIPFIAKYVSEKLEKNESILLFVWHREVAEILNGEFTQSGIIIGGTDSKMREHLIDLFQRKIIKILIMNIAAAGRGHNLQSADRVVFGEFSWSDETNLQAEKRASRKGSTKEFVRCEYIVCPDSIDEMVMNSIFTKESRVDRIIG